MEHSEPDEILAELLERLIEMQNCHGQEMIALQGSCAYLFERQCGQTPDPLASV